MKKPLLFLMVLVLLVGSFYGGVWFVEYRSSDLSEQGLILYPLTVVAAAGGTVDFQVAIADESAERTRGLQIVDHLRSSEGMWFVFDNEEVRRFWMKDMSISLDILFVSKRFEILAISENVPPCSEVDVTQENCPVYSSVEPVQYVLEVPARTVEKQNVAIGDTILSPFL